MADWGFCIMSKVTEGIVRINQELDKISGLDGIAADKIAGLETEVKEMVFDILENHSEASTFNYWGNNKSGISNMLNEIDKEPLLEEVLNNGKVIISKAYCDAETEYFMRYQIISYDEMLYFIEHRETECITFKKL